MSRLWVNQRGYNSKFSHGTEPINFVFCPKTKKCLHASVPPPPCGTRHRLYPESGTNGCRQRIFRWVGKSAQIWERDGRSRVPRPRDRAAPARRVQAAAGGAAAAHMLGEQEHFTFFFTPFFPLFLQERLSHGISSGGFPGAPGRATAADFQHPYFPPPFAPPPAAAQQTAQEVFAQAPHLDPYNVTNSLHSFQASQVSTIVVRFFSKVMIFVWSIK